MNTKKRYMRINLQFSLLLVSLFFIGNYSLYASNTYNFYWNNDEGVNYYRYQIVNQESNEWVYTEDNHISLSLDTFPVNLTLQQSFDNESWSKSSNTQISKNANNQIETKQIETNPIRFKSGLIVSLGYSLNQWSLANLNSYEEYSRKIVPFGANFSVLDLYKYNKVSFNMGTSVEIMPFDLNFNSLATRLTIYPELNYKVATSTNIFIRPQVDFIFSGLKNGQAKFFPLFINDSESFSLSINPGIIFGGNYLITDNIELEMGAGMKMLSKNVNIEMLLGINYLF